MIQRHRSPRPARRGATPLVSPDRSSRSPRATASRPSMLTRGSAHRRGGYSPSDWGGAVAGVGRLGKARSVFSGIEPLQPHPSPCQFRVNIAPRCSGRAGHDRPGTPARGEGAIERMAKFGVGAGHLRWRGTVAARRPPPAAPGARSGVSVRRFRFRPRRRGGGGRCARPTSRAARPKSRARAR